VIDKKTFNRVNKVLGGYSPDTLIDSLETIVAMMRNAQSASNVDVELYFMDYSKLLWKMQRLNPADLDTALVAQHGKTLAKLLPRFADTSLPEHSYVAGLEHFCRWGVVFSEYAQKAQDQIVEQKKLDELLQGRRRIEESMIQITAFEDLNRKEGLYDMYDAMGASLGNRNAFSQLMQRDGERAQALKDRVANFEADLAKRFG
jgi:hypothetical protein